MRWRRKREPQKREHVAGFFHPVVPKVAGLYQMSAAHTPDKLRAVDDPRVQNNRATRLRGTLPNRYRDLMIDLLETSSDHLIFKTP